MTDFDASLISSASHDRAAEHQPTRNPVLVPLYVAAIMVFQLGWLAMLAWSAYQALAAFAR